MKITYYHKGNDELEFKHNGIYYTLDELDVEYFLEDGYPRVNIRSFVFKKWSNTQGEYVIEEPKEHIINELEELLIDEINWDEVIEDMMPDPDWEYDASKEA